MRRNNKDKVKKDRSFTDSSVLTAARIPKSLDAEAREKCRAEDITFSQLMRKALRRELAGNKEAA
jgi:hypothetical protein